MRFMTIQEFREIFLIILSCYKVEQWQKTLNRFYEVCSDDEILGTNFRKLQKRVWKDKLIKLRKIEIILKIAMEGIA